MTNPPRYIVTRERPGFAVWDTVKKVIVTPVYRSRAHAQEAADEHNDPNPKYGWIDQDGQYHEYSYH